MVTVKDATGEGGQGLPSPISMKEFDRATVSIRTAMFTEAEFNSIRSFLLEDDGTVPDRKAVAGLLNMTRDMIQKMATGLRKSTAEMSRAQLDIMKKDSEIEALKEEIRKLKSLSPGYGQTGVTASVEEMGMDSVDLAKALCWRSKESGRVLYRNQMQSMLYIMYGKCLAESGARMTREHPQAWEFGPVFPRVYSKVKGTDDESFREQSEALREGHPGMSQLLDDTVSRCSWRGGKELLSFIASEGSPYLNSRERNPEKKTAPLEDDEIRDWFSRHTAANNREQSTR